jgi:hypothetical protein
LPFVQLWCPQQCEDESQVSSWAVQQLPPSQVLTHSSEEEQAAPSRPFFSGVLAMAPIASSEKTSRAPIRAGSELTFMVFSSCRGSGGGVRRRLSGLG